jgi:propionate CoA-transferase
MGFFERLRLLLHIIRWRLTWSKKDLNFRPRGQVSAKFITAREAARLIPDGATVFSNGLAGNARCSVFFWALRELFQKTGHPRDLTWVNVGAQGGRGKVPGTIEEIGLPGLMRQYIAGHLETCKAQLRLAEQGKLELHTLPQGVMSLLLEEQAARKTHLQSPVGLGTFLDTRLGEGSALSVGAKNQYVAPAGDALIYRLPKIEIAMFNAPYADAEGNIYFKNAASWTENLQSAAAARANGGKVFVTVSALIPKNEADISLPADAVDYIVVHPYNEQTSSIPQRRFWPMFTAGAVVDFAAASRQLRFINNVLKITPERGEVEFALARLGARVFAESVREGAMVNIGVGFPEEVARQLVEHGVADDLLFTTEAGSYGGLPAPGIFFSAAVGPQHLEPSSVMFRRYQSELDVAVLGFLQVDSAGNVNASHRGPRMTDLVGPGGFPDIANGVRTVIFVGTWMAGARFALKNRQLVIEKAVLCKFVEQVSHITFSGREALRMGKKVFYVTNVGVFALTPKGLELREVMPGIDVERDILKGCPAQIHLPLNGKLKTVDAAVLSGEGFYLKLRPSAKAAKFSEV